MLSRFHTIPERNKRTDGLTDGQTDVLYQYRMLTRDKHTHTCRQLNNNNNVYYAYSNKRELIN